VREGALTRSHNQNECEVPHSQAPDFRVRDDRNLGETASGPEVGRKKTLSAGFWYRLQEAALIRLELFELFRKTFGQRSDRS